MYSFRDLQRARKQKNVGKEIRIAVVGDSATQLFAETIEGYGKIEKLNISMYDAGYNLINEQLINPSSDVFGFNPNYIVLWLSTEKMHEDFLECALSDRSGFAELIIQRIEHYWSLIEKNSDAKIIQLNFFELDDKPLGQLSCKVESTFVYQIRKLNYLLQDIASKNNRVFLVDTLNLQIEVGREFFFKPPLYYSAKMAVSLNVLPYLSKLIIDIIKAISGIVKKCIIVDLDNTLWGGVIGDDGLAGIEIGELGKGYVFTDIQRWLKQLKEYGIILAVCSKNDEWVAKEPFEKHEEMVLSLDDISVFVANWEDKASNIRLIQESLNIGMDSIVFIDDNPFERKLVKSLIPEIEVPDLPEDPSRWLVFLQNQNYFETGTYVADESDRTKLYQAEFERKKLERSFDSIDDYLISLEMIGEAKPFDPMKCSRIAQLTQRSNQFNLRTIRYTSDDIERMMNDDRYITLYFTLMDRFGDHGLVAVVILEKKTENELFVDTWLMSCRVLKRGMEEFVANHIVSTACQYGFGIITAEYIETNKNQMVKNLYERIGFEKTGDNFFSLKVQNYKILKTYVKEK